MGVGVEGEPSFNIICRLLSDLLTFCTGGNNNNKRGFLERSSTAQGGSTGCFTITL